MHLNYCLLVTGPAYGNQRASSALQFAEAIIAYGHCIQTVFFYQDGVLNANRFTAPATDETNLVLAWQHMAQQNHVKLYVCVAAALRRGIIDATQASELYLDSHNMLPDFQLSGLGSLAQAVLTCDRFIQF